MESWRRIEKIGRKIEKIERKIEKIRRRELKSGRLGREDREGMEVKS